MASRRYRSLRRSLRRRDRRYLLTAVLAGLVLAVFAQAGAHGHADSAGGGAPGPAAVAAAPASVSGNVALGQRLAGGYGWGAGSQWNCLYALWQRESGWSNTADTRVTGLDPPGAAVFAYGIAQARPATKMPLPGQPAGLGGQSDTATQIRWGLGYIQATYADPCGAWSHEEAAGWY
jgi:hypothetical protein